MRQQYELQELFGNYLCSEESDGLEDQFRSPHFQAKDVLAIHRNNFKLTLIQALEASFPATKALIGEDCFAAHMGRFVESCPPSNPVLSFYGEGLPDYLDQQRALSEVPYLGDVARLEWAWNDSFHSADREPLTPQNLYCGAPEPGDRTEFDLHPSMRLVASPYPIMEIWQYARFPDQTSNEPAPLDGPQHLLILRPHAQVLVIPVDRGTYCFLQACKKKDGFTKALTAASRASREFSPEELLPRLLVWGAFCSIKTQLEDTEND